MIFKIIVDIDCIRRAMSPKKTNATKSKGKRGLHRRDGVRGPERVWKVARLPLFLASGRGTSDPLLLVITVLITLGFTGCVQRRLIVRSQPEGALVTIDNQSAGRTPVPVPYTYAGTREIQLEKDGYKTIKVRERIRPKWYDTFPLSFFSNNLALREIRDERVLDFQMEPRTQVQENQLLDRANDLRTNVERGTVTAPIR